MKSNLPPLPPNNNEYWEGERYVCTNPVRVGICTTHTKENWLEGTYIDNKDGSITCSVCPWGTIMPGYLRVIKGKIYDLRNFHSQ